MPILLLALLLVLPKLTGKSARTNEAQRQTNADALRAVFNLVLAPLQQVAQGMRFRVTSVVGIGSGSMKPATIFYIERKPSGMSQQKRLVWKNTFSG